MHSTTKKFALFPFFLVFYEIANYLSNDMYLPALPAIAKDFSITPHYAQMTLTAWFLGSMSLQLILGPLSDRIGRRPVLLGGGILFIISSVICALTSNIYLLFIARFFQGSTVCSIAAAGYASIHESYEQRKAIHTLAIMGSITVLAPAFGPLLGSIILQWLHWRWIFGISIILAIMPLSALWLWMPESNSGEKRVIIKWQQIFKNYKSILTNAHFILNSLTFCFTFIGAIAWITAGPFLVIDNFKLSPLAFGILQVFVFGSLIVASQMVKYFMERIGVQRLINLGVIISLIAGLLSLIITFIFPHFLFGLIVPLIVFVFGSSLTFSPSQRMAIDSCTESMGARMAVYSTLITLGGATSGLLVSLTYNGTLFWFASLLTIVAGLACFVRILESKSCR